MAEKGGKGISLSKGGAKSSLKTPGSLKGKDDSSPKRVPKVQFDSEELPKNAECLMDCEAADILQGIQEQMVILSEDPTIKIPIPFDRGLQYATGGIRYTSSQSVRRVLEPLKKHGVTDREISMIANIRPESVDEVFALIPSLKGKKKKLTEPLKVALSELVELKQPA